MHALARAIARALLLAAAWLAGPAVATVVSPQQAEIIVSSQTEPPAADDPRWRTVTLTHVERAPAAWYRVRFDADLADPAWMLYLPFLYGGGRISVNGVPVAQVTETSAELYISWERPVMLSLPQGALRAQGNELLVRVAAAHNSRSAMMSQPTLGPQIDLQPLFDRRLFAVRTMPVVTVIGGLTVGVLVLLIWVRRRREVLYGLFGLAAILWALRTTTFVFDALPAATWQVWGLLYFVSTGGFIVVMAIFTLALAGWSRPLVVRGLLGYWALGPLAYLLGEREFHGLLLRVTPDVLVPRPDTEVLVDWALEVLADLDCRTTPTVADLGTGSGAIALALKQAHGAAQVCAVERSPAALAVARTNGERLGLPVEWLQGDWFSPLSGRRFDLIVSNPPYIDGADAHLAALHAEPREALTPGPDGLSALRVLARNAPYHLQPGGWLLLEHGHDQGAAVRALLQDAGLALVQTRRDLGGQERCTAGRQDPA